LETYFEPRPNTVAAGLVKESAIALGFFDGVHHGHQVVIGSAKKEAERLGVRCGVVTFKDHPRTLTRGRSPLLLTVIEQRLNLFAGLGVDFALVLSFTEELCKLSPREYVENILVSGLGARSISVGPNHHFGRDAEGDAALLEQLGSKNNFVVHVADMILKNGTEVSSSAIRELVTTSRMEQAADLLSRPYALFGQVVEGDKRGQAIGFPTANLELYPFQLVPGRGVYAGRATLDGGKGQTVPCVINVGYRPTFKSQSASTAAAGNCCKTDDQSAATEVAAQTNGQLTVEAHLLDFSANLYGQFIEVEFLNYLRAEQKFSGVDALKAQIHKDIEHAIAYMKQCDDKRLSAETEPEHRLHA